MSYHADANVSFDGRATSDKSEAETREQEREKKKIIMKETEASLRFIKDRQDHQREFAKQQRRSADGEKSWVSRTWGKLTKPDPLAADFKQMRCIWRGGLEVGAPYFIR